MQILNSQGNRYAVLVRPPPSAGVSVPAPYTVEGFLSTFTPAQRRELLMAMASPSLHIVDPSVLRTQANDALVLRTLALLTQRRFVAFCYVTNGKPATSNQGVRTGGLTTAAPVASRAAPPPPPVKQAVHEEIVCELLAIEAKCSHKGRAANKQGLLEVVPDSDDDLIRLSSTLRGGCGQHTRWEIQTSGHSEVKKGLETTFIAKSWGFKLIAGIFEVMPRSFYVNATACSGMTKQLEIKAYPIDKWEISADVDFKKLPTDWKWKVKISPWEESGVSLSNQILTKLRDRKKQLDYAMDKVLKPLLGKEVEFEFLHTKLKFEGRWKEYAKDHRCYYHYVAELMCEPLFKAELMIPFGPTAAIPPFIKTWVTDWIGDLYLYIKFFGELILKGMFARETPDANKVEVEAKGKLGVKVGGNLFLMKKGALNIDVNCNSHITLEAKGAVSRKPGVHYDIQWAGLIIELTIEALWGCVEHKRKWHALEPCSLLERMLGHKPEPWYPFGE